MNGPGVNTIRTEFWIMGAILLASVFVLSVHLSTNNMEFSQYNIGWNGTSSFFSDLDRHRSIEISDPKELAGYRPNTTLLIIAPYHHPTTEEIAAYDAFLHNGNTIFLADDFGTGNEILEGLGSSISFLPGNLSSFDRKYADSSSVVAYRSPEESPVSLPASLTLNGPSALDGGSPLFMTTILSWVDTEVNGKLDAGEAMGMFPVMVRESKGEGQLIVLSDSSIFINSMYAEDDDNRALIRNIVSSDGTVLIDQMNSRTADANGFSEILHVIRTITPIEILMLCLMMLTLACAWKKKMI
jgi:hypothetical protein